MKKPERCACLYVRQRENKNPSAPYYAWQRQGLRVAGLGVHTLIFISGGEGCACDKVLAFYSCLAVVSLPPLLFLHASLFHSAG